MPTEKEIADAEAKKKADADAAAKAKADADGKGEGDGDKDIIIKQSELDQIKSDRDNYQKGMMKKKADERNLDGKKGDEDAGDNKGGSAAVIDEGKVEEIAKKHSSAAVDGIYKSNESRAKRQFLGKYGELIDDAKWQGFMSHFTTKRGKATVEDIVDDLEDAMLLWKRDTGKLDEHIKSESERARREGRMEGQMDNGRSGGDAGDRNEGGKKAGNLSPKGEEMARNMHVDPKKAKEVDTSKDSVINVV